MGETLFQDDFISFPGTQKLRHMKTLISPSKSLTIPIPKFNGGTFDCIIDTSPDFHQLFQVLGSKYAICKKYVLIDEYIYQEYDKLVERIRLHEGVMIIPVSSNERTKSFDKT